MSWYKISLPNESSQNLALHIQMAFAEIYLANRGPKDVALLISETPNPPLVENCLYFTPMASRLCADLIRQYNGQPCPEPSPSESGLLAGDEAYFSATRAAKANDKKA